MEIHRHVGHAGLVGWRKALADRIAPLAAKHDRVSEDQVRTILGAAFFAVSVYYVVATLARAIKSRRNE